MTRRTLTDTLEAAFAFAVPVTWYGGLLALIGLNLGPNFEAIEVPPAPERIVMLDQTFALDTLQVTEDGPDLEAEEEILADSAPAEAAESSASSEPSEALDAAGEAVPTQASAPVEETTPEASIAAVLETAAVGIPGVRVRTSLGATAMSPPKRPKTKNKPNCDTDDGIVQVNGMEYSVPRDLVDHYTKNLSAAAKLAYVSWNTDGGGDVDGFKVRRMNCANVLRQAGLMNGDVIHKINGRKVTTIAQALKAYTRLRNNRTLKLEVTRKDGTTLNLKYKLS